MSVLKHIRINYINKLIEDLIQKKNFDKLQLEFKDLKKKFPDVYFQSLPKLIKTLINDPSADALFNRNLIWINSYHLKDIDIIENFLNFYFTNLGINNYNFSGFQERTSECLNQYGYSSAVFSFENLIYLNEFIQYEISENNYDQNIFLKTNQAFYEQKTFNNYFLYNNLTRCYFYIIRNPIDIYFELSESNDEKAPDMIFNHTSHIEKVGKFQIQDGSQSWKVNTESWTNENVKSTFNGMIINYEELINNPLEIFTSVIGHLNQSGLDISLNYSIMENFIDENLNLFREIKTKPTISNQKLKIFKRECGILADKYGFF